MADAIPTFRRKEAGQDRRPSAAQRGYGAKWRKERAAWLRRHPVCQRCRIKPAEHVDHVKRLTELRRGEKAVLQSLCHECHSYVTLIYDGGAGRPKRDDKPNYGEGETDGDDTDV